MLSYIDLLPGSYQIEIFQKEGKKRKIIGVEMLVFLSQVSQMFSLWL